ncbi:MAG TPA: urease subunit beta [Dehalococcoidia bacterium]|nr:urease subunit beta [Dehalococcoidia bacterium]
MNGPYLLDSGDIELNVGRVRRALRVANTGDRPIQIGSHAHFFEVNRALVFDRIGAYGMRLDIPSGTAIRFEPGDVREVTLVELAGRRIARGMNALVEGPTAHDQTRSDALRRARSVGFIAEDAP